MRGSSRATRINARATDKPIAALLKDLKSRDMRLTDVHGEVVSELLA